MLQSRRFVLIPALAIFVALAWFWQASSTTHSPDMRFPDGSSEAEPQFDVGFNLGPSSGSIAIDYRNGTVIVERVVGDEAYCETMARLSLPSSAHLAPPYNDLGDRMDDRWRVFKRSMRKRLGLPASADVGAISTVISHLRELTESRLSITISSAAVSVPHLVALYQDDIQDAMEYVRLGYIEIYGYFRPVLWEAAVGFAGHGLGLCEHWQDAAKCRQEYQDIPQRSVLTVHYAPNALTLSLAKLKSPLSLWEPGWRHYENFTLGSMYEPEKTLQESEYWKTLRDAFEFFLLQQTGVYEPAHTLIFLGESAPASAHEPFAQLLYSVLDKVQPRPLQVFSKDPTHVAAKGTAELVKRFPAPNNAATLAVGGGGSQVRLSAQEQPHDNGTAFETDHLGL